MVVDWDIFHLQRFTSSWYWRGNTLDRHNRNMDSFYRGEYLGFSWHPLDEGVITHRMKPFRDMWE